MEIKYYGIVSLSDQPSVVLACPQQILSGNILTPKYDGSLILDILTNRSHWVNSKILLVNIFTVVVYDETGWTILNEHLSYKPTSYWGVLFWSGVCPRQFSRLKRFRALVVPGGGCHKWIILQGGQIKRRFSCGRPFIIEKKSGCNWSVYPCTHTE